MTLRGLFSHAGDFSPFGQFSASPGMGGYLGVGFVIPNLNLAQRVGQRKPGTYRDSKYCWKHVGDTSSQVARFAVLG